ncbi:MAG: hypothetical protein NTY65_04145, partial [Planctomycetota bacterium]|nr:hypothetical protein [Planctomycetota bacterium]
KHYDGAYASGPNYTETTDLERVMLIAKGAVEMVAACLGAKFLGPEAAKIGVPGENLAPINGAGAYENLVNEARLAYPNKAGIIENHHCTPTYLGGEADGPRVPLDAAYHQQITNAFRRASPYGQPAPDPVTLQSIMQKVYSQYPLPPRTK